MIQSMQSETPHAITVCGAKTRSGELCKNPPVSGAKRCRMHGGKSLAGIASPSLKTGRYSKYLPDRLMERYQSALTDGDLLAMSEEIALVDARLADLLARVDTGESGAAWSGIAEAAGEIRKAMRTGDNIKTYAALMELELLVEQGAGDYAAWGELQSLIQQRRALVESERKRLVEMQQTMTVNQAMTLVTALLESVRTHVTDRDALSAISTDISLLLSAANTR